MKAAVIKAFVVRTGETEEIAIKYLGLNYWSLKTALTFYQQDRNEGKL